MNITEVQTAECRKVGARRRDIQLWTELYGNHTTGMIEAIFAAAYGTETRITTNIPGGTRNITVITLWWLIPFSWVVTVMLGSFICVGVLWLYGARPVAHDEKSLVKLLERKPGPLKVELRSDFDFVEWK